MGNLEIFENINRQSLEEDYYLSEFFLVFNINYGIKTYGIKTYSNFFNYRKL